MSKADKITINGTDVTSYVIRSRFEINPDIRTEDKGTANIEPEVLTSGTLSTIKINDTVVYYRGESTANQQRWEGYVSKVNSQTGSINLEFKGEMTRIDRKEINYTFDYDVDTEAGVISEIASTIMTDGGITPSVVDSGTTNIFKVFSCRREVRSRKLKELADTLRWACYYDHNNGQGLFQPKGYTAINSTLTVGSYPLINAPIWEEDDSSLYNQFTVEGLEVQVGRTDWFSGDASTTDFEMTEYPVGVNAVWSGSNNFKTTRPTDTDLVTGGAEDVTADADYFWREESKILKFATGSIPSSGTNNVQVDYNYNEAMPGFFIDEGSQDDYGEREKTVTVLYITNAEDLDQLGFSLLQEFKDPKLSTRLLIGNDLTEYPESANIYPNKTLNVVDNQAPKPISKTLIIQKVILNYPEPYDEVDVGERTISVDDFLERTVDRIKKLEDRFKTRGGLRQYRVFNPTVEFPTQMDIFSASPEAGVLYWGDDNQGDWGDFNWGDGTDETETLIRRLHHPEGWMYFDLYDDDLSNTTASSATVNTTNGTVTFTTGQFFETFILFRNNQSYATILLENDDVEVTGGANLTYKACADGSDETWETITPGTTHTFLTTNTGGIKVRVEASGSATIKFKDSTSETPLPWKITVT